MLLIHHRRNTPELIAETPAWAGVEIDIRTYGDQLIVHHDPFTQAITLDEWLIHYHHAFIILNTKEEGLETRLLSVMDQAGISDFFFLDQSFPFLIKTARSGEHRCAVRLSEYESIETVLSLAGLVDWVWVDVFTELPLTRAGYEQLKAANFKLCLVSPELQGHSLNLLQDIQNQLRTDNLVLDAVCTKYLDHWLPFKDNRHGE